ncbi:hypothetical protein E2C01_074833 [Portunus trituberculatus]|uniref:Uncharacterized protein n=1 Tax=Portunus trituberculatus TaxID=210409 RepID=A0A5B7IEJ4_PORTR|nr:hypothetical protein [Portunus trituberculatus]
MSRRALPSTHTSGTNPGGGQCQISYVGNDEGEAAGGRGERWKEGSTAGWFTSVRQTGVERGHCRLQTLFGIPDLEIPCTPGRGDRPAALTGDAPAKAVQDPCVRSVFARPGTVKWCVRRPVCVHLLDSTFTR